MSSVDMVIIAVIIVIGAIILGAYAYMGFGWLFFDGAVIEFD